MFFLTCRCHFPFFFSAMLSFWSIFLSACYFELWMLPYIYSYFHYFAHIEGNFERHRHLAEWLRHLLGALASHIKVPGLCYQFQLREAGVELAIKPSLCPVCIRVVPYLLENSGLLGAVVGVTHRFCSLSSPELLSALIRFHEASPSSPRLVSLYVSVSSLLWVM